MKLISWNVNGLRACIQKGFLEEFDRLDADFFCLQETKLQEGQINLELPGYEQYWCYAEKKGYSGTAIFTKHTPISVSYGIGAEDLDNEGRVITLEYPEFYLVTCYTPNAQRGLARIGHRMKWDDAFRAYIKKLDEKHPVILCGDLNVAHQEIDLKNPQSNRGNAGFSDEERESFTKTLELGFTDTFRHLHPDATGMYSWWSYMYNARQNNAGWRIDYFLVSDRIKEQVFRTPIYKDIMGSDHCPVGLELDILCNGSMWSPASMGKARDLTPVKEKKSPKIVTTCLACILALGLGIFAGTKLFPSETPQPEGPAVPTAYTATIHTTPLTALQMTMSPSTSMLWDCLYMRGTQEFYYYLGSETPNTLPGAPLPAGAPANFFIRLELTEVGYEQNLQAQFPEIALQEQTGILMMKLRAYYEPDDFTKIAGWFLYGYCTDYAKVDVTLNDETLPIRLEPMAIDMRDTVYKLFVYEDIHNNQWTLHPENPSIWGSYTAGGNVYNLLNTNQSAFPTVTDINFVLRLELTEFGKTLVSLCGLWPSLEHPYHSSFVIPTGPTVIQPYYHENPSAIDGFLIYGTLDDTTDFRVTLGDDAQVALVVPGRKTLQYYTVYPNSYMTVRPVTKPGNGQLSFQEGNNRYYPTTGQTLVQNDSYNFFVRIALTEEGQAYFKGLDAPTVTLLNPPGGNANITSIKICSYYTGNDPELVEGWIIYGHTSSIGSKWITIQLALHMEQVQIYDCTLPNAIPG